MARNLEIKPWQDYSHELNLHQSQAMRWFYLIVSKLALIAGIIGIFLPLLPTTPFILLAAFCYSRCSPRFYNWIMNHRIFGPPLRQWVEKRSITRRVKWMASTMITVTLVPSTLLFVPILGVKILLLIIGASVITYLWRLPTTPDDTTKS